MNGNYSRKCGQMLMKMVIWSNLYFSDKEAFLFSKDKGYNIHPQNAYNFSM